MTTQEKEEIVQTIWSIVKTDSLAASKIGLPARETIEKLSDILTTLTTTDKQIEV